MVLEALIEGLSILFSPATFTVIIVGAIISLVFGIIPGISGLVSMALFLPFVYRVPPEVALPFLVSLVSCGFTGGSITAILINIPGTGGNAATVLDGFPMTQNGEGSRAIGAAVMSSIMGGVAGVPIALLMVMAVVPFVMAFKSPELCVLVVVGLAFMAVLGGESKIKGLISGGLGLIASFIGFQESTGEPRFAWGSVLLYDGLGLVPVILGTFAIPELLDMITKRKSTLSVQKADLKRGGIFQGIKDVYTHKWLWFRSTIIGYIIGIIPGMGGEIATFVAYGQAKQTSRNPEKFGTGCVEGVIAPESSNNAKEASALLTTVAFGIPGSAAMAILLGGFLLVGVIPGPRMLTDHLPLVFTLMLGIAIANVAGGIICLFAARYLIKVTAVNIDFLFPMIAVIAFVSASIVKQSHFAILIVIVFSVIGFLMKRLGYSRSALVLAFILGELFEKYFFRAYWLHGPFFFFTPLSMAMIIMVILLFTYPYLGMAFHRLFVKRPGAEKHETRI